MSAIVPPGDYDAVVGSEGLTFTPKVPPWQPPAAVYWGAWPGAQQYSRRITRIARSGNTATATLDSPYDWKAGDRIEIAGTANYNGEKKLTGTPAPDQVSFAAATGGTETLGVMRDTVFPQQEGARSHDHFEQGVGKPPAVVGYGGSWVMSNGAPRMFPAAQFDRIFAAGAIPLMPWQPAKGGGTYDVQPDFRTALIAQGTGSLGNTSGAALSFDEYIEQFAKDAAAYGRPFFLRLAHEMNGDWYPWSDGHNGNAAGDYVLMWRHVHEVFSALCPFATWLWIPNRKAAASGNTFQGLYPGDDYIDWVGHDGYNKGAWLDWDGVHREPYQAITALAPTKPYYIAEYGCMEGGAATDKPRWFDGLAARLKADYPHVCGLSYWNYNTEGYTTNNVESSQASLAAYGQAMADPYFGGTIPPDRAKIEPMR